MNTRRITICLRNELFDELERLARLHPLLNRHAIAATALAVGLERLPGSPALLVEVVGQRRVRIPSRRGANK